MNFTDYITVFNNISKNFSYLKSDFVGIQLSASIFMHFIANIFITVLLMAVYYRIGRKIRLLFFKSNNYNKFSDYINVALGYIFTNSGLAILGVFSLFYPVILVMYASAILVIAFCPYRESQNIWSELIKLFNSAISRIETNRWVYLGVFLFVVIAFLRLIPPEIGEDAIGYHTSDPHLFLKNHTSIISDSYVALPVPHLGEMSYMLSEFIGFKDSARYIHFSFYLLAAVLLMSVNSYSALFFVTAPVVIQISSKANVDFQWIFCWLLSIFILTQNRLNKTKNIILIGILFGGVLASKLWTIAFFPIFILYLLIYYRKLHLKNKIKVIFAFSIAAFLIDTIWLLRSYIITGDPVYPGGGSIGLSNLIGFNKLMFHIQNISVFSPLFYLGTIVLLFNWRYSLKILHKLNLSLFFVFLVTEYLFVKYHFGRYLLGLYSLAVLIIAAGVSSRIRKYYIYKVILIVVFGVMFVYYFTNTLLILPYGLGWADNNKYLTRVLYRDNSSYYDFDGKFSRFISSKDKVATFGIYGYYYANFDYVDIGSIFNQGNKSLKLLSEKRITKLLIKGGDILWFCKALSLRDCNSGKIKLLASYPEGVGKYNLYSIARL